MKCSALYTTIHRAIREEARGRKIDPYGARIVLAVYERGNHVSTLDLESDLSEDGSMLRRALIGLYISGLATGAGADGGPRRKGVRTVVTLTDSGLEMAEAIKARVREALA